MAIRRRPSRALSRRPQYTIEIAGRRYPVDGVLQAAELISRFNSQYSAGEIGARFPIREDEKVIGFGSYNGKIWKGEPSEWVQHELMYDPFAEDPVPYKGRRYAR